MAAILDFTQNAMPKIYFDSTNMSDMPENSIVDTKNHESAPIMHLLLDLAQMTTILDFAAIFRF